MAEIKLKSTSTIERKEDGTIQLKITVPWTDLEQIKEEIITKAVEEAEITGFRKGKAPKDLVEKKLDQGKIKEEMLRKVLPQAYIQAVQQHNINPIINPKIHVDKLEDGNDWEITALTCEIPEVKLNNYKETVQKITAKSKIIIPGKEKQEPSMDELINALIESTTIKIPSLIVEQEIDRMLSQMLDEIKRLGLTLDQYLASTNKKVEDLRAEYQKKAETDIKLEFVLQKVAETEKIIVEDKEIEEAIQKAKNPIERKNLEKNRYVLASILRQQKTLDFLKNL